MVTVDPCIILMAFDLPDEFVTESPKIVLLLIERVFENDSHFIPITVVVPFEVIFEILLAEQFKSPGCTVGPR